MVCYLRIKQMEFIMTATTVTTRGTGTARTAVAVAFVAPVVATVTVVAPVAATPAVGAPVGKRNSLFGDVQE